MTSVLLRPRLAVVLPRDLPPLVDVFGAGRAVRALLTVAALQATACRFRIWCRHHSRAELLRVHLADLPPLDVEIVVGESPPSGSGPLVLAMGQRTSRRSRQSSKDALFSENMAIIEGLMPGLAGRTVIVVTNPSTRLTARLQSRGVAALGMGVMNDQLRFEREGPPNVRLIGAHNPFELGFGQLGAGSGDAGLSFSRTAYRDLTNRQDRQRPLLDPDGVLARLTPRLHEQAWRDLGQLHDGLDQAKRWYARQRLASRYLENGIACGRAILALVDFLTGKVALRADLTVEVPLTLPGRMPFIAAWPLDSLTGEPRALFCDAASMAVIDGLATSHAADGVFVPPEQPTDRPIVRSVSLRAAGILDLTCSGRDMGELVADIVPLAMIDPQVTIPRLADIDIRVLDAAECLPLHPEEGTAPLLEVAQHRGKNAFEHRDLTVQVLPGGRRLVAFGVSGARCLVDDASRQITLAVARGGSQRDEFRKLVRDQILTPAHAAAGAWVLHAGLLAVAGKGLLLLGDSGAGKTTGALHLLSAQKGGYGASERVLVSMSGGQLVGLGVPESLTVFRGSLRGLPHFADLVEHHDPDKDWARGYKLRLTRDDVVARLGTHQLTLPVPISQVALLRYQPANAGASVADLTGPEARRAVLHANDLTTSDDVRAAWLNWFEPARDGVVEEAVAGPAMPFHVVEWSSPSALAATLAHLLAVGAGRGVAP